MRSTLSAALAATLAAAPAMAGELRLNIEIPRLEVAEYHRPYLVAWVEGADQQAAATLAIWYDTRLRNERGQQWLRNLRQWWRRGGQEVTVPADGVSGATRAPGRHELGFDTAAAALKELAPGTYSLVVEVARESGGRELVRLPLQWPPAPQQAEAQGSSELGKVSLAIRP